MGPLSASSVSPHDLSLSWTTVSGHFDGFVVRVSDPEQLSDTLEFRMPGEARNITISNLMDATTYDIELYGISHGRHTPSVLAHAVTGTTYFSHVLTCSSKIFASKFIELRFFISCFLNLPQWLNSNFIAMSNYICSSEACNTIRAHLANILTTCWFLVQSFALLLKCSKDHE